jgi:hypothetical protein
VNTNGLLGSTILEVVIGLVFVYLLLAIICTTVNEWIAGIMNTRSTTLSSAIKQLLDGQSGGPASQDLNWFLKQFYAHPLITGMQQPGQGGAHPAYLQARVFATAVMDVATPQKPGVISFQDLETGINNLPNGDVKSALLALIQNAQGDLDRAQKNIENWFDDTMGRVSGWYKRRTQVWTACIAVALTLATNADTLRVVRTLWNNPTQRAQIVERAKNPPQAGQPASSEQLNQLSQILGWSQSEKCDSEGSNRTRCCLEWLERILGWILTIVAVSLGAPFWFDVLNKFMRVRNAGDAPDETSKAPAK